MLCLLLRANPDTGKEAEDGDGVEGGDDASLASEIRKMLARGRGRGHRGMTPHGVTARAVLTPAVSSMPSNDLAQNSSPAPHISESAQPNVSLTPADASVTKNVCGKTKGLALAKIRGRREKVKLGFPRTLSDAERKFPGGEYNKLKARKIDPLEVLEKINPSAYHLVIPWFLLSSPCELKLAELTLRAQLTSSLGNLLHSLYADHRGSWDQKLCQVEFAFNRSVNRNTGLSPFQVVYGFNPRAPIDLAPVPDLKRASGKAEEFMQDLQQIHKDTEQHLHSISAKYKEAADKKHRFVEFEVGDFIYAVLTKDRFLEGEYNKLKARKIGPVEILEKINPNAYRSNLPSHIRTADVFNVKHLVPFRGDSSSDEDPNSRANFFLVGEDDAVRLEEEYHLRHRVA